MYQAPETRKKVTCWVIERHFGGHHTWTLPGHVF